MKHTYECKTETVISVANTADTLMGTLMGLREETDLAPKDQDLYIPPSPNLCTLDKTDVFPHKKQ